MLHKSTDLTFYLIRHAQSRGNLHPEYIGGNEENAPLTEEGIKQANLLRQRLIKEKITFDFVYSSKFTRSHQTARIVLPLVPVIYADALRELDQGEWTGKSRDNIYTPENKSYINTKGYLFTPPMGESLKMAERRISNWLEDEILNNPKFLDKPLKIAIFSHGNVLKCLIHYIMGFNDRLIYRIPLTNTSISVFKFTSEGWFPIKINDFAHRTIMEPTTL